MIYAESHSVVQSVQECVANHHTLSPPSELNFEI